MNLTSALTVGVSKQKDIQKKKEKIKNIQKIVIELISK
jgi:hypothetical protein